MGGLSMSDPRELVTAHLTPHGVQLEIVGGRTTVDLSEVLQHMDFAMVLGMIGPKPAGMLLAKYADDHQEYRKCRIWWLQECIETAHEKGWKRPRARMIEQMAFATIEEHMGAGTRCEMCKGTKERMFGHTVIECPDCYGKGFIEYGPEVYAGRIGFHAYEWDRVWRERVAWARRALYRWEQDAAERLIAKMGRY